MILAGIDIGTNSLRLLIADINHEGFRELYSDRKTTRLGQNLDTTGRLSDDAIEHSLEALRSFQCHIRRFSARHAVTVGTSALRNASNADLFLSAARDQTGISIEVISGLDEARIMLRGVRAALAAKGKPNLLDSALVIDIGGGSTEFIVTAQSGAPLMRSLNLGAVYLHDRYIENAPPGSEELFSVREAIWSELKKPASVLSFHSDPGGKPATLIGTAGTITTLAAIDQVMQVYDPDKINGSVLTRAAVGKIIERLSGSTLPERRAIPGLEHGREDIILPGALITFEIMERYGYGTMFVSDWGVREGIILDLYDNVKDEKP